MYTRRSCFNNHREGLSRYAGTKFMTSKTTVIDETAKKSIIQMQKSENRRNLIYALASA